MASFTSILSSVGHAFKVFFTDATKVAQAAEPIIDIAFPGVAFLYNNTVNAVVAAENAAIAAGAQNGTGAQKLAIVTKAIENAYNDYAAANGIPVVPANVELWVNAVVATLNSIPSALPTQATSAVKV